MDTLMLVFGLALAWAAGVALLAAVAASTASSNKPGEVAWILGCGWFVGAFLATLCMRALSVGGMPFGIISIGAPLAALTAVSAWYAWRKRAAGHSPIAAVRALAGAELGGWPRVLWFLVLGWLAFRFALLLTEIVWRPLYPWDAWTQWGTKARVWFELRTMAPFVSASDWLQATGPDVYFDAAPHYPATVPLLQVWAATLLGRWDDTLINLPWWLTGIAFGFALYGFLRQQSFAPLSALIGAWLVLSLPILDVHIALAGYADLAMATYFTLAALSSMRWLTTRNWSDAGIALLLLVACVLIKNPGKIWVLTLIPGIIVALLPRYGLRIAAAGFGTAVFLAAVLARSEATLLGYRLHVDIELPWRALLDAYFALGNWHLLWYGAIGVALLGWRQLLSRGLAPYTVTVAAGVIFLLFGFAFTNAGAWVEDQSTVNRATLHLAPLIIVWMLLVFRAWARSSDSLASIAPTPQTETRT
jgi:hypothetical protein